MAEIEDVKEMTRQESEELEIETSAAEDEIPDAPDEEQVTELKINEEILEEKEGAGETMATEMQQEEVDGGEIAIEGRMTEGNKGVMGKGEWGLEERNEDVGSGLTLSADTAKELEENLREAIDGPNVELNAGLSEQNPSGEHENQSKSVADAQNQLQESGGREEIDVLTAVKDIGLSAAPEGTRGEDVQGFKDQDSPAPCTADEEGSGAVGNAEEGQTGSGGEAGLWVTIAAEPDFKEQSDNTKETPVSGHRGDRPEDCGAEVAVVAGQTELSTCTVMDNGSMVTSNGKSGGGDTLLKETQDGMDGADEAHMCQDQEPTTDVETGQEALSETAETGLQTVDDADLQIQTKGVEILETPAKGSEEGLATPPASAPPCLGNLTECLEALEQNQGAETGPLAEKVGGSPVGTGDNPTEKLPTGDAEEQASSNGGGPSQDVQVAEAAGYAEEREPSLGNLVKPTPAMGPPTTAPGGSTDVSTTSPEQQCEGGMSETEDQEPTAPGDDQIIVAEEE
ncbi:uncharacterized protein LOC144507530 [Mustelus asterias]